MNQYGLHEFDKAWTDNQQLVNVYQAGQRAKAQLDAADESDTDEEGDARRQKKRGWGRGMGH